MSVPLAEIDTADEQLAVALNAVKAAGLALGDHWVRTSHLAEAFKDIYHARMAMAAEKRGRQRLGETE